MIASLCWKEYREQRGLWLAVAVLAVLLAFGIGSLAPGGVREASGDSTIQAVLVSLLVSLAIGYGVICGAQLLAGEKETGTLMFLDTLAAHRGPVWHTKFVMGAGFTLAQALFVGSVLALLRLASASYLGLVVIMAIAALPCGMAAGAWCASVFPAVLIGVVLAIGGLVLSLLMPPSLLGFTLVGVAVITGEFSRRYYCETKQDRRRPTVMGSPSGIHVLYWLELRQGRWVILAGLGLSAVAGYFVSQAFEYLWPLATLVIGLTCGLAVFASEQPGEHQQFLGTQRLPPGRVWIGKNIAWALVSLGMLGLLAATYYLNTIRFMGGYHSHIYLLNGCAALVIGLACGVAVFASEQPGRMWIGKRFTWAMTAVGMLGLLAATYYFNTIERPGNVGYERLLFRYAWLSPWSFGIVWLAYGFSVGQLFSLLARKIVTATVLAYALSFLTLLLWLPSMIFGDLAAWQVLAVPLFLLLAIRLSLWAWFSGRLYTSRPLWGLACSGLVIAGWLTGCLWYRAVEFPFAEAPFDVEAYEASLDEAAQSEATSRIIAAVRDWEQHEKAVTEKHGLMSKQTVPVGTGELWEARRITYNEALRVICVRGWPKEDADFGQWLDAMFAGSWAKSMASAVKMPLGLLVDPRRYTPSGGFDDRRRIVALFSARALQLQARGEDQAALEHFEAALALVRQLLHHAPGWDLIYSRAAEPAVASAMHSWLKNAGPRGDLLRKALDIVRQHEQQAPGALDALKAIYIACLLSPDYFRDRAGYGVIERRIFQAGRETPWEKERNRRVLNAMIGDQFARAQSPRNQPPWLEDPDGYKPSALERTYPFRSLVAESIGFYRGLPRRWDRYLVQLRACELLLALALYQAEHGKPPTQLTDLAPRYLNAIPLNPLRDEPFSYKVSKGEKIKGVFADSDVAREEELQPGQAVLWFEAERRHNKERVIEKHYFPVPTWGKE